MEFRVDNPGLLTTVQDLGRWGYLGRGMPLAGAMDTIALKMGNIMVGNPVNMASLEITLMGPALTVTAGEAVAVLTGADPGLTINGKLTPAWRCFRIRSGDTLSFRGPSGKGCRAYLCISGGIEVDPVMGSRSTYLRGKMGGFNGRPLAKGDVIHTGEPHLLWKRFDDFECPEDLLPDYGLQTKLKAVPGPQDTLFTENGLKTFFSSEYTITTSADRMGYRLEGPVIEHLGGPDIISDAIPPGSVQVPGNGQPIVMLSDGQTTGGYAKIAVLTTLARCTLAQRLPGQTVFFERTDQTSAILETRQFTEKLNRLAIARAAFSTGHSIFHMEERESASGSMNMKINDRIWKVDWELLDK